MSPGAASRARALRRRYISSSLLLFGPLGSHQLRKRRGREENKTSSRRFFSFLSVQKNLTPWTRYFPSFGLPPPFGHTRAVISSLPFTGTILYSTRNEHTAVLQKYDRRKIRRESVSSFYMFGMLLVGTTVCFRVVPLFHHPVLSRIQRKCVVPGVGGITERCYDD